MDACRNRIRSLITARTLKGCVIVAGLSLAATGVSTSGGASSGASTPGASTLAVPYADLPGWADDRHQDAFEVFVRSCRQPAALRAGLPAPPALARACEAALSLSPSGHDAARRFFERWFTPFRITPRTPEGETSSGFLTGYFEPEYPGSLARSADFQTPLYGRPADLVTLDAGTIIPGLPTGFQAARRMPDGRLLAYPDRRDIDMGGAAQGWPVIAWLRDHVDRFVMQVQGSARLRLPDGSVKRIAYAGRNGHPYVSLGRLLSQAEKIPPADMTMDRLVARLKSDAEWGKAFIWNNPSFVFFRLADELDPQDGPIGGAGVPLTAHRSIAADRGIWPYGLPVWLDGTIPVQERGKTERLQRLSIIQDTGSAIVGAARFDLFYGSGPDAGFVAGLTRHNVEATILWPHENAR